MKNFGYKKGGAIYYRDNKNFLLVNSTMKYNTIISLPNTTK